MKYNGNIGIFLFSVDQVGQRQFSKVYFEKCSFLQVIKEGKAITGDLGGSAKCSEFTEEIIRKIEQS